MASRRDATMASSASKRGKVALPTVSPADTAGGRKLTRTEPPMREFEQSCPKREYSFPRRTCETMRG